MLKLEFKSTNYHSESKIEFYNSITRIPFTIRIGNHFEIPESIYYDNIYDETFVDFRFVKSDNSLFEINLICTNNEHVNEKEDVLDITDEQYFICKLIESDRILRDSVPVKFLKRTGSLQLLFNQSDRLSFSYFKIAHNIYLSTNEEGFLTSIVLDGLSTDDIYNILGF